MAAGTETPTLGLLLLQRPRAQPLAAEGYFGGKKKAVLRPNPVTVTLCYTNGTKHGWVLSPRCIGFAE